MCQIKVWKFVLLVCNRGHPLNHHPTCLSTAWRDAYSICVRVQQSESVNSITSIKPRFKNLSSLGLVQSNLGSSDSAISSSCRSGSGLCCGGGWVPLVGGGSRHRGGNAGSTPQIIDRGRQGVDAHTSPAMHGIEYFGCRNASLEMIFSASSNLMMCLLMSLFWLEAIWYSPQCLGLAVAVQEADACQLAKLPVLSLLRSSAWSSVSS